MSRSLKVRDLTLRDGQQSLFATRMKQESIDKLLPLYKDAGFYAMEVWCSARLRDALPWRRPMGAFENNQRRNGRSVETDSALPWPQPVRLCALPDKRA